MRRRAGPRSAAAGFARAQSPQMTASTAHARSCACEGERSAGHPSAKAATSRAPTSGDHRMASYKMTRARPMSARWQHAQATMRHRAARAAWARTWPSAPSSPSWCALPFPQPPSSSSQSGVSRARVAAARRRARAWLATWSKVASPSARQSTSAGASTRVARRFSCASACDAAAASSEAAAAGWAPAAAFSAASSASTSSIKEGTRLATMPSSTSEAR
mmetsp:Transcript_12972/g.34607  ORF Transcript_12972/g.34607 Transcript_12972/m.34607 type:complete len:219 (+) Transcript_12972:1105-1761(+)